MIIVRVLNGGLSRSKIAIRPQNLACSSLSARVLRQNSKTVSRAQVASVAKSPKYFLSLSLRSRIFLHFLSVQGLETSKLRPDPAYF